MKYFKAFFLAFYLLASSTIVDAAPRKTNCFALVEEFIGSMDTSPTRDFSARIEESSMAQREPIIRSFVSSQPSPFWSSDFFKQDFFLKNRRSPVVGDAFESMKRRVFALDKKIQTLSSQVETHENSFYFDTFRSQLRKIVIAAKKNFEKSSLDKKRLYTHSDHYTIISNFLLVPTLGELAELKVALSRANVIGRSIYPFTLKGINLSNMTLVQKIFKESLEREIDHLVRNIELGGLSVDKIKRQYPRLAGTIVEDEKDIFVNKLRSKIETKEIDLISINPESGKITFHEVKHSEKTVGRIAGTRKSIVDQARLTLEILQFTRLDKIVETEVVFPFGGDKELAKSLEAIGVYHDGEVRVSEIPIDEMVVVPDFLKEGLESN
ncbi:hypothetical protein HBN50_08690 [Halobacteriovorax sp. GB3]|uniref:hypothetical protein n=1 Tax=Halobacteriovorax sp. GB3 TaxID=2719615 RepID=UPI002362E4E5|nr:hypothetical protein [Halobacteriovorax sp. GB3]MDD0853172.1 hypothetical protein [Halobacteriovorax sp. GB3]